MKKMFNLPNSLRVLLLVLMLCGIRHAAMAQEPYTQTITGKIKAGDSCRTVDPVFIDEDTWAKRESDLSVQNVISFEIRQDTNIYYYKRPFSCKLNFDIQYFDEQAGSHELSNQELVVAFDTTRGGTYKGVAMYRFSGGYSVHVKVNSIESPQLGGQDSLPAIFRIKNEIFIDRKFKFSTANEDIMHHSLLNNGRQLRINWMTSYSYPGAEFFDLEWTFYTDSSEVGKRILSSHTIAQLQSGDISLPATELDNIFRDNSTRITTHAKEYVLNIVYPAGFLVYRVRGARINGLTGERENGDWTYQASMGSGQVKSSVVYLASDHAAGLNYAYEANFAEEGLRAEKVIYFDGAQKSRQLVMVDNSIRRTIASEPIYDVMGRNAVQLLPSVEPDSTLHFIPGLTRNKQGQPYSYKDLGTDSCVVRPDAVALTDGAGRYYSANNPHPKTGRQSFNNYIPDAEGYPFSTTIYTPDNTGRKREEAGVGAEHQPGNGHTTRYFYGAADELELDRLFGSEVGNSSHYMKNMVLDVNGQISVAYVDMHGRTVATAFAGPKPENMYELPGSAQSVTRVTKELAKPENTVRDAGAFTVTSNTTLMIPMAGNYHFDYSYGPQSVTTASCEANPVDICADCYYDLLIDIQDECGVSLHKELRPAVLTGIEVSCGQQAPEVKGAFDVMLPIGEYQVTYQLLASKAAAEYYDSAYQRANTCIQSLDDFKRQFLATTDFSGCYSDCNACETALGTKDAFVDRYISMLIEEDMEPNSSDETAAATMYDNLLYNCRNNCADFASNSCEDMYANLLADVSPGGQYAMYDFNGLEDENVTDILLQQSVNVLTNYTTITDYKDADGTASLVQNDAGEMVAPQALGIKEFIRNFRPSWSASFVKFHPEYCFYKWCSLISDSKDFDEQLDITEDVKIAVGKGWWNRNNALVLLEKDPFFKAGAAGQSQYTAMKNVLEHYSKVVQTNMQAGDASIMQVIRYLVYCSKDSTVTSFAACQGPADCNAGLDEGLEWLLYKNFYKQEKAKLVAKARATNSDPEIRDCKNCYIGYAMGECDPVADPDCSNYKQLVAAMGSCPEYYPANDERKSLYAGKMRQYLDELSTASLGEQLTSKSMQQLKDSLDIQIQQQVASSCLSNCEAQADGWMQSLQYCEQLVNGTDSTKYRAVRAGLIAVCAKGCDINHPMGSSTIAPGVVNTDTSFEAVIIRVLGAAAIKDSCTALLISHPLPYAVQEPATAALTAFDVCTCENLQALQAEYQLRGGGAGGFLRFLKRKFGSGFRLTQNELNVLLKKCGGGECVSALELPSILPDALRCKTCVSCEAVSSMISSFDSAHTALSKDSDIYEKLLANYLNLQLGFSLTYPEYYEFVQQCSTVNHESDGDDIPCIDFKRAYNHFLQFKPDYYANPNGSTGVAARFREHMTNWLNLELGRKLNYNAYRSAAIRCGMAINEPQDSMPIVCKNPLTPGDSVFACPPSVMNCCRMDGYIQQFHNAFPGGVNARLLAYYFEMQRQQWCAPAGLPVISYREPYNMLKDYFTNTLKFPKKSIIDVTKDSITITMSGQLDCGLDYNFGAAIPFIDNEAYRLCNHSPVIEVEYDSLACFRSQFKMALINGGLAHERYMDSLRREYQEIYLSRCLSVQPHLKMTGDLYEYHYTLYYYDQAGNRVKTIPPAGVSLLTNAEIAQVEHDRPYNSPECYGVADTLQFKGGGYIPLDLSLNSRLSRTYGFEDWLSLDSYAGSHALFSEEIKVSAPERYIDSTRTIPAFNGTKGIGCFIKDDYLYFRIGRKPAYFPDTLFMTQTVRSAQPLSSFAPAGKWMHLVINGTGSTFQPFQVYVNGKAVAMSLATIVDTLGSAPVEEGTASFKLGTGLIDNAWTYYTGYMKQLRFYDRTLRYPEVVANRDNSCGLPSNESGLVIWAPMNEGRDTSRVNDLVQHGEIATYNPSAFSWMRHHDPFYPKHTLASTYKYNSIEQTVQQYTPDGDTLRFWFDRTGRVIASMNAEQLRPSNGDLAERYSYSKYDSLNRVIETGEKTGSSITGVNMLDTAAVAVWLQSGHNRQVTSTRYDNPLEGLDIVQSNLRNRVASTVVDEDGDGVYEVATHYSYDIGGNVKTFWQELKSMETVLKGQGMKRVDYDYDLVTGNINKIIYQAGKKDQFYYRNLYDANNKLIESSSSRDGLIWQRDAAYQYYLHGSLARVELGQYQVQGMDYVYNLKNWIKGMNAVQLDPDGDMGKDGKAGTLYENFARDVTSFTLGYHNNDYKPIVTNGTGGFNSNYKYPSSLSVGNNLYNGNITSSTVAFSNINGGAATGTAYGYDQLNRLVLKQHNAISSGWSPLDDYKESLSYDANGNILKVQRNGTTLNGQQLNMDKLTYHYQAGTNRLTYVNDSVPAGNYNGDIDNQNAGNYVYDKMGNLVADQQEGVQRIDWRYNGKILQVVKGADTISYSYDASANRIGIKEGNSKTFYVRDLGGKVLAVYDLKDDSLRWDEQHLYGAKRLGMWKPATSDISGDFVFEKDSVLRGSRYYELSNHLGNVLTTITDKKTGISVDTQHVDYYVADVVGQQDYYPFGMLMPGRKYSVAGAYRYGFNGKENDNNVKGEGNQQDYGMRIYDPRLGKFLSVDPLTKDYPELTPYQFASNMPVAAIDIDGEEAKLTITTEVTGYTVQFAYGFTGRMAIVVPTYRMILTDMSNGEVVAKYNVTRDGWYYIGEKDDKYIYINRAFEPKDGEVNLYAGVGTNYPDGLDAYALRQYQKGTLNAVPIESKRLDGTPIDKPRRDPNKAEGVMIHIGGWWGGGRLGGSYGCFGFVPDHQIYKTKSEADAAYKKGDFQRTETSNDKYKKYMRKVVSIQSKYDQSPKAKKNLKGIIYIQVKKRNGDLKWRKIIDRPRSWYENIF